MASISGVAEIALLTWLSSNVFALFSVLNTEGYLFSSCFHGFVYRVAVWEKVQLPSLSFNNVSDYTK